MKLFLRIIAGLLGLFLLLILLCVLFPSIPGNLIASRLQNRLPEGVAVTGLSVSPLGDVKLAELQIQREGNHLRIKDLATRVTLASLRGPRRSGGLQIGSIQLDTAGKIHLEGRAGLEFSQDQPEQFSLGYQGEELRLRFPMEDHEPVQLSLSLAGHLWNKDSLSGDCHLQLLDGELLAEFKNQDSVTNIQLQTVNPLNPITIHQNNPLIPYRLNALEAWLTAEVKLNHGQADGVIRFHTGIGQLITLESTNPVSLYPTGFGEVPTQLGLSPEFSSQFDRISGSVLLGNGGADIHLAIDSPHHQLTLDGRLQDQFFTGNLILALSPETLARNTLGLHFARIGPGEQFRIYGKFTGPVDDIATSWDLDRRKLLEGAADGLKQRLFNIWK